MDQRWPVRSGSRWLFVPKTEWQEQDEGLTLRVHLPAGVQEKHIECRIIAPSQYIRVCSDPSLKDWHFDTLFNNIPERFNLYEAKTQFVGGILTIRVPKIIPTQASSNQEDGSKDGQMAQKGREESPSNSKPTLSFADITEKIDEHIIPAEEVSDQEAIRRKKEKEKEEDAKDEEEKEKEEDAKDNENASSSPNRVVNGDARVVTERRFIIDKCTILSLILAIGAYVAYNMYGHSRKKN